MLRHSIRSLNRHCVPKFNISLNVFNRPLNIKRFNSTYEPKTEPKPKLDFITKNIKFEIPKSIEFKIPNREIVKQYCFSFEEEYIEKRFWHLTPLFAICGWLFSLYVIKLEIELNKIKDPNKKLLRSDKYCYQILGFGGGILLGGIISVTFPISIPILLLNEIGCFLTE